MDLPDLAHPHPGTACRLLLADRRDGGRAGSPLGCGARPVGRCCWRCRRPSMRSSWPAQRTCCGSPGTRLRGGGFSFTPQPLEPVPDSVLFRQSLTASVVNPKVAVFYLSLFPQFVDPASGSVLLQSLALGIVHVTVSTLVDGCPRHRCRCAFRLARRRPGWLRMQRWMLGRAFGAPRDLACADTSATLGPAHVNCGSAQANGGRKSRAP